MTEASDRHPVHERGIEYYGSVVEVVAAITLRSASGWTAISAGRIDDSKLWVEFERTSAEGSAFSSEP